MSDQELLKLLDCLKLNIDVINDNSVLFGDYMKDWLEIHKVKIQKSTYEGYYKVIHNYISPYFLKTGKKVNQITTEDIEKYYSFQISKGLSANTVLKHHANIRKALSYAKKKHIIRYNPAIDAELPKKDVYIHTYYTPDEIKELLKIVANTKLFIPVLISSLLGLRRSEIVALQWDCIDLKNNTIVIKRKATFLRSDNSLVIENKLKNSSSYRTLCIPQILSDYLNQEKKKQKENIVKNKEQYNSKYKNFVCIDDYGNIISPDYITYTFRNFIKNNNLKPIRFHDLRHSFASALRTQGVDMKQIQEWLGHSNYSTTANIYTHVDFIDKRYAAEKINQLMH
ncbi:site-specific recombinase XerD [Hydrogenoanaerobacterium saccharovorans]|uniref:Site-specific recombinase XerD n=1 Tax=Hydrogenoanaerobacterium saccharovorans TaxID=474960 RepID=A0A1H8CZ40_9FIRM|nr:site-specific integrase [Hydrogenoanaerobacterium saccharovorans]RPF43359.1 site-specific recombinase XerD [Hydrogenoanaerobacterium saccharovorans]SEM99487.1 Site-specific recombinase XerD [Hydrogenoanaerobacterium saccharovorans]